MSRSVRVPMPGESRIERYDPLRFSQMVVCRKMLESDIEAVLELESRCFPDAWSRTNLSNEVLANQFSFPYVGILDTTVAAYAIVWCVADEAELTNFAVDNQFRRRGVGWSLLNHVAGEVKKQGVAIIHLEVRRSNIAARILYSKFGFEEVGLRKNYYLKEMEDAILMRINLGEVPLDGLV